MHVKNVKNCYFLQECVTVKEKLTQKVKEKWKNLVRFLKCLKRKEEHWQSSQIGHYWWSNKGRSKRENGFRKKEYCGQTNDYNYDNSLSHFCPITFWTKTIEKL